MNSFQHIFFSSSLKKTEKTRANQIVYIDDDAQNESINLREYMKKMLKSKTKRPTEKKTTFDLNQKFPDLFLQLFTTTLRKKDKALNRLSTLRYRLRSN